MCVNGLNLLNSTKREEEHSLLLPPFDPLCPKAFPITSPSISWPCSFHLLLHMSGFVFSRSRSTFSPWSVCMIHFNTKLCHTRCTRGEVRERPVVLRDLIGQSTVSSKTEPVGCCQCLGGVHTAQLHDYNNKEEKNYINQLAQCVGPPGKCQFVCQIASPAPVTNQW